MTTIPSFALGGYFGLELPMERGEYHRQALRYQSARAAFLALLRAGQPSAIWMPWYLCDSMLEPAIQAGIPVLRYRLDEQLRVLDAQPRPGEWLVYVNYFGLCDRHVKDVLDRFAPDQVIIDNSQAFFSAPSDCLATLYSPRKFFGVPDGGYLMTRHDLQEPTAVDEHSVSRCMHLLQRLGGETEKGYPDFLVAEASLSRQEPRRMSALTQTMLRCIPYHDIRAVRQRNAAELHARLGASNQFSLALPQDAAPLCYPYRAAYGSAPQDLRAHRISLPSYWPDVAAAPMTPAFERSLATDTLFLPCDQRMDTTSIERLLQALAAPPHRHANTPSTFQ